MRSYGTVVPAVDIGPPIRRTDIGRERGERLQSLRHLQELLGPRGHTLPFCGDDVVAVCASEQGDCTEERNGRGPGTAWEASLPAPEAEGQ
jgi:hypothetical protein